MRCRGCAPGCFVFVFGSASRDAISRASRTATPVATHTGTSTIGRIPSHWATAGSSGIHQLITVLPIVVHHGKYRKVRWGNPLSDVWGKYSVTHQSPSSFREFHQAAAQFIAGARSSRRVAHSGTHSPRTGRPLGRSLDALTSTTNYIATHRDWLMFTHFAAETNWKSIGLPPNLAPREVPAGPPSLERDRYPPPPGRLSAPARRRPTPGSASIRTQYFTAPHRTASTPIRRPRRPSRTPSGVVSTCAYPTDRIPVTTSASSPLDLRTAPL